MNITYGLDDLFPHEAILPTGFEWWYVDALLDDDISLVLIFFRANPLAPDGIGATPPPSFVIALRSSTTPSFYLFRQFTDEEVTIRTDGPSLLLTCPDATVHIDPVASRLSINADALSKLGTRRLQLEAALHLPAFQHPASVVENDGHTWNLIAPRAPIDGIARLHVGARERSTWSLRGMAYVDHNYSPVPLFSHESPWYWGRAHVEDLTVVYYSYLDPNKPTTFWIWEGPELRYHHEHGSRLSHATQRTAMGLRYDSSFSFVGAEPSIEVHQHRILDYGPFYLRFLADITITGLPGSPRRGRGLTEFMHPSRLGWRLFHPFVNMRIDRYGQYRVKTERPPRCCR